jgi:hypothetical protein
LYMAISPIKELISDGLLTGITLNIFLDLS